MKYVCVCVWGGGGGGGGGGALHSAFPSVYLANYDKLVKATSWTGFCTGNYDITKQCDL